MIELLPKIATASCRAPMNLLLVMKCLVLMVK